MGVQRGDQSEAGLEQPLIQRLLQGAFRSGQVLAEELEVAAEVEDVEVLLVLSGPNRSRRSRVPRPIICQNLVLDRTGLKNTRLTISGTSMPVSSMSTEIAMCGALSGTEKSSIRLWA